MFQSKATKATKAKIAAVREACEAERRRVLAARAEAGTGADLAVDSLAVDMDALGVKEERKESQPELPSEDAMEDEEEDLLRAAQAESMRSTLKPKEEEDDDNTSAAGEEDEGVEEDEGEQGGDRVPPPSARVLRPFPVPDGSIVATASFAKKAAEVVNVHEGDELLRPAMYIFDSEDKYLSNILDDEAQRKQAEANTARALAVANAHAPTPDALYAPLYAPQKQEEIDYASLGRIHAPWPIPGDLVTAESSMEQIETADDLRVSYPLDAGAEKKHFMAWQLDPQRNYGDTMAFSMPLHLVRPPKKMDPKTGEVDTNAPPNPRSMVLPAIVLRASFAKDPVNTLSGEVPGSTWGAGLSAVSPQGFQCDRNDLAPLAKDTVIHTLSAEHAELFNSPEFRRWAGVDAEAAKRRIRAEIKPSVNADGSTPTPSSLFFMTLRPDDAKLVGYVKVPLVLRPKTLSQLLVLSHAAELHVASQNLRRVPTSKLPLLKLDMSKRKEEEDNSLAAEKGYIGHVLVHLDALDAVIDYYCTKYHPGQFVAETTLLKIIPNPQAMHDLEGMASAENKAGVLSKFMYLRADLDVTFMPYNGPIHPLPGSMASLLHMDALINDARSDEDSWNALKEEVRAEGLDPEDKNPCYVVMFTRFVEKKMAERAIAEDAAKWASTYDPHAGERTREARHHRAFAREPSTGPKVRDIWDETFIPSSQSEQRAQSARDMRQVRRLTAPPMGDHGDTEW